MDLRGGVRYQQATTHDDATRAETATDRNGISTKRERDGLGRVEASTSASTTPSLQGEEVALVAVT